LSSLDIAGEQLEGSSSEETHRRKANPRLPVVRARNARTTAASSSLALSRSKGFPRHRLRVAGLVSLLFIVALAVLLPKREVHIAVDGALVSVSSRSENAGSVVRSAGIGLETGDLIERIDRDDLVVRRAIEANVTADGRTYALRTQATSIGEVLRAADVQYSDQDSIYRDGELVEGDDQLTAPLAALASAPPSEPVLSSNIEVRRAVPLTIIENGQELQLQSSRATLASALQAAGVRVGPGDAVRPALSTELTSGLEVHIDHARRLVVTVPEGKLVLYTLAETVGEAVAAAAVDLPTDYKLDPPPDTVVGAGLAVHVIGLSAEQVEETERIESQTIYEPDPDLAYGEQRVVEGQDGVVHRAYTLTYEDDQQTGRELASEWYDPEPADTIIYYSTAAEPRQPAPVAAAYVGDWSDIVCSYGWDCEWALAVIQCESGGNANAYNGAGYVGLFQIWEGHGANLTDPATNIAAAYSLYLSGGAGNWPNCP